MGTRERHLAQLPHSPSRPGDPSAPATFSVWASLCITIRNMAPFAKAGTAALCANEPCVGHVPFQYVAPWLNSLRGARSPITLCLLRSQRIWGKSQPQPLRGRKPDLLLASRSRRPWTAVSSPSSKRQRAHQLGAPGPGNRIPGSHSRRGQGDWGSGRWTSASLVSQSYYGKTSQPSSSS